MIETPAFKAAMKKIEEERRHCTNAERRAGLDCKELAYQYIGRSRAWEGAEVARGLNAAYDYTRQKSGFEDGAYILGHNEKLPNDAFEIARYCWFSVPRWWRDMSGDGAKKELEYGVDCPASPNAVCIEEGTVIQRWEMSSGEPGTSDYSRSQGFVPYGCARFDGRLALVIRQWVEMNNDAKNGDVESVEDALAKNKAWQHLLADYSTGWTDEDDWLLMRTLQANGLPYTPSVRRYFRQQCNKKAGIASATKIKPCRGGMVTTFVIAKPWTNDNYNWRGYDWYDGEITHREVHQITTPAIEDARSWITAPFFADARKCAIRHVEWADKVMHGNLNRAKMNRGLEGGSKTLYPEAEKRIRAWVGGDKTFTKIKICSDLRMEMEKVAGAPVAEQKANKHFNNRCSRLRNPSK